MIDYHKTLVSVLSEILPTHHEFKLASGVKTPCITYAEDDNSDYMVGDTLAYSELSYIVKVWGSNIGELNKYATQISEALRPLGWRRTSSGELWDQAHSMCQKILIFSATAYETF